MLEVIKKFFYRLLIIIILFYLTIIIILFYIGPIETRTVRNNLNKNNINIIVSLTTSPNKINHIKLVLNSLSKQSIKPNKIYLNLPKNIEYIIPKWLQQDPSIIINRSKNYESLTKLLPTLEQEQDPNVIIITVTDDNIYPKHMVRDLAKQYLKETYPVNYKQAAAITGLGINFLFGPKFELESYNLIISDRPSLNVISYGGVVYKRSFFKDDIFVAFNNMPKSCYLNEDLIISLYLMANNISIVKITGISYNEFVLNILNKNLLINKFFNYHAYSQCLASLPNYNKVKYQHAIIDRSKIIYTQSGLEIFRYNINKLYYTYLSKIINYIPLVKSMIIMTFK